MSNITALPNTYKDIGDRISKSGHDLTTVALTSIYTDVQPSLNVEWHTPILVTCCEQKEIGVDLYDLLSETMSQMNGIHVYAPLKGLHKLQDEVTPEKLNKFLVSQHDRLDTMRKVAGSVAELWQAGARVHVHCNHGVHRSGLYLAYFYAAVGVQHD